MAAGLIIIVDDPTMKRLVAIAHAESRTEAELAEAAVSEAALDYFRHRTDDPAKTNVEAGAA